MRCQRIAMRIFAWDHISSAKLILVILDSDGDATNTMWSTFRTTQFVGAQNACFASSLPQYIKHRKACTIRTSTRFNDSSTGGRKTEEKEEKEEKPFLSSLFCHFLTSFSLFFLFSRCQRTFPVVITPHPPACALNDSSPSPQRRRL